MQVQNGERLVAPREVKHLVGGLSESSIRRLIAEGKFPKPITLARNRHGRPVRVAFIETEVLAWITATIKAARATAA